MGGRAPVPHGIGVTGNNMVSLENGGVGAVCSVSLEQFVAVDRQQRLQLLLILWPMVMKMVLVASRSRRRRRRRRAADPHCRRRRRCAGGGAGGARPAAGGAAERAVDVEPPANHLRQDKPEARVEEEVHVEVGGRVDDDQQVADASKVELQPAAEAGVVAEQRPHQLGRQRRRLTHGEHENDDDQHQGDVAVLRRARRFRTLHPTCP